MDQHTQNVTSSFKKKSRKTNYVEQIVHHIYFLFIGKNEYKVHIYIQSTYP